MKSWKTSLAAVLGLLSLAATQGSAMLDNDPATVPDWGLVITGTIACIGLIMAKDSNVTGGTVKQ